MMKTTGLRILFLSMIALSANHSANSQEPLIKDYTELTDTKPRDSVAVWDKQKAPVQLQWGSIDVRYPKWNIPTAVQGKKWQGTGWKGEQLNAQAVLWTSKRLENVSLEVSDLSSGSSVIPSAAITPGFVRYVMTDELNKDKKGGCGHRPDKTLWDSSLVADVLDAQMRSEIAERVAQPIWLSIRIPQEVKQGKYKGTLTVKANDMAPLTLSFEIKVLNRTLPPAKDWSFHLDLWQNPYAVARYYDVPLWSDAHFAAMRPLMQQLANAGQKVITATIMHKPWNGQTEDAFSSMVFKMKKLDGGWTYDYTVFDKWVEFMMSMGIDRQINCFTLVPWALKFDYFDQATNQVVFIEAKPGEPAYDDYWFNYLKDFSKHLRSKGWFDKTTISMDEREQDMMKKAFELIKKADPEFKISGQGNYYPEIEPFMHDFCLAYNQNVPADVLDARRKAGKVTTVYTCCTEPYPNVFTFSQPAEAVWTIWHSVAGGYDGYLRWAYNSWTKDPLRDSRFRTWAAGDCYLVYPGRSSIRMERLMEGVQDAEKIRILRSELQAKGQNAGLEKLNKAVSLFVPENLTEANAAEMVNNARKVLNSF